MPIVRNPNSATALANRIDRQTETQIIHSSVGVLDIDTAPFELIVSEAAFNWEVKEVAINFSAATARNFSISKLVGARIVANLNDHFWIRHTVSGSPLRIIIAPGFHVTTASFATAIKTALEAQSDLSAASITFTVVYAKPTGNLTITPSSGQVGFVYDTGTTNPVSNPVRNISLAGPAMGFNEDMPLAASITGDTGIDVETEYDYVALTANAALSYVTTDVFEMDMDSALKITSNSVTGALVMKARVSHEVIRSIR